MNYLTDTMIPVYKFLPDPLDPQKTVTLKKEVAFYSGILNYVSSADNIASLKPEVYLRL